MIKDENRSVTVRLTMMLLFMSLTSLLVAQTGRVKVSGHVRDAEGNPLDLVAVQVKNTMHGVITNEKGFYSLNVKMGDSITLLFSCLGYNKAERIIPSADQDMRLNVQMNYSSVVIGEVTVSSLRKQTTTMETLDASKMRILPDPSGGSIESLVVTYAGVSSSNELSSQYSVRGGSYDENIVYVNGMEVFRPLLIRSGQQEGLTFINPNMIETVSFSAGGFEPRYGDRMSSVLDISYKKPEALEGSASVSTLGLSGTISTANLYVGSSKGRFTQITGVRYKMSRSLLKTMDVKAEYTPRFVDFQTFMTYRLSPRWQIEFLGNISSNSYEFIPVKLETAFGTMKKARKFIVYFDGKERDLFQSFYGAWTVKHQLNAHSEVGIQGFLFRTKEEESYDLTGNYRLDLAGTEEIENAVSTLSVASYHEHARNRLFANVAHMGVYGITQVANKHAIKWGAYMQMEKIMDKISEWGRRDSSGYSMPYTGQEVNVVSNLYSDNQLSGMRFSGYLQDVFKFRSPQGLFTVVGGVRGSYWSFNQELLLSPRASVGFIPNINQQMTFRLAGGVYYQAPFYKELRVEMLDGNGDNIVHLNDRLKSQRSVHLILGGDYSFKASNRNFKLTAELYYKKLTQVNPYTVDNLKVRYYGENCATGYVAGIDLKFFGEFVPGTDSWLSLSLLRSQQTIRETIKAPIPNSPAYNLALYFQDYFPGYRRAMVNLKGVLSGGLPVTVPHQGYEGGVFRTTPYRRVDLGFTYQLVGGEDQLMSRPLFKDLKSIWLGLDLFNLFDIQNTGSYYWVTDVYGYQHSVPNYLTGRQFNLRLTVDF